MPERARQCPGESFHGDARVTPPLSQRFIENASASHPRSHRDDDDDDDDDELGLRGSAGPKAYATDRLSRMPSASSGGMSWVERTKRHAFYLGHSISHQMSNNAATAGDNPCKLGCDGGLVQ